MPQVHLGPSSRSRGGDPVDALPALCFLRDKPLHVPGGFRLPATQTDKKGLHMIPATTGHMQGVDTCVTIGAGILEERLGALLCNPRHLYETRQKISVAVLCVSDTTPVELWDRTVFRVLCLGDVT